MIYKFPQSVAPGAHFLFSNNRLEKFNLAELESIGDGAQLDFSNNKFPADQIAALLVKLADLNWRNGLLDISGASVTLDSATEAAIAKLESNGCTIIHG